MNKRTFGDYLLITLRGLAMGAADVVPGVSGGTIAFITGIYDELIDSIKQCGPSALRVLFKDGCAAMWQHINGNFLLALVTGILISVKTFASVISFGLEYYPIQVWSFFSGLILASIWMLAREHMHWDLRHLAAGLAGMVFVVAIAISKPTQLPGDWWILFLGGTVAISAMILPGVSGSFILLLVGLYPVFIGAIEDVNIPLLASFGGGCIIGLMVFSRVLSWLLHHYHSVTLATLIGFLVGSLYVTWPWKRVLETVVDRHGEVVPVLERNTGPFAFAAETGDHHYLLAAIVSAAAGIFLVLFAEFIAKKMGRGT